MMISKSVAARNNSRSFATGVDYITEHAHERACRQAGRSFGDGIGYASAPKKAAWVQLRGVTSVGTAALEMEAVAVLSRRCKDPVYHLIVAYAKGERPTREQVVSDAERLLKAMAWSATSTCWRHTRTPTTTTPTSSPSHRTRRQGE
jgi:hypothetical protein